VFEKLGRTRKDQGMNRVPNQAVGGPLMQGIGIYLKEALSSWKDNL